MTLFVDASALVAMIAGEDEGPGFADVLTAGSDIVWSAMVCWETISALRRSHGFDHAHARRAVETVAEHAEFRLVEIGQNELPVALQAYQTFGRGSGHPAKLNMGDCFAYACAKTNGAALLYKGGDFALTDLK
ncbi:MAG: type II toxin-antitoxin system VapC family toxin [Pseudomonadota bacterium]